MPLVLAQLAVVLGSGVFVALILLGLPGTWLVLAMAALCEWGTDERLFSGTTWALVVTLAVAGELWEFFASALRARRAGAGRKGAIGALGGGLLGALIGTFLLPVPLIGSLVGGGLGAFAGSAMLEHGGGRELLDALRVGRAAGIGHVLGMVGKLVAGVGVWTALAVAVLWR